MSYNTVDIQWKLSGIYGGVEVIPVVEPSVEQHYLGDECWCRPLTASAVCAGCGKRYKIFIHKHKSFINNELPEAVKVAYRDVLEAHTTIAKQQVREGHHGIST